MNILGLQRFLYFGFVLMLVGCNAEDSDTPSDDDSNQDFRGQSTSSQKGPQGPIGPAGPQGPKGDPGNPAVINTTCPLDHYLENIVNGLGVCKPLPTTLPRARIFNLADEGNSRYLSTRSENVYLTRFDNLDLPRGKWLVQAHVRIDGVRDRWRAFHVVVNDQPSSTYSKFVDNEHSYSSRLDFTAPFIVDSDGRIDVQVTANDHGALLVDLKITAIEIAEN